MFIYSSILFESSSLQGQLELISIVRGQFWMRWFGNWHITLYFLEKSVWLRWLLILTVIWCSTGIPQLCKCILMDIWMEKILDKSGIDCSCEVMQGYWKKVLWIGIANNEYNSTYSVCSVILNNMLLCQCQSNVPEAFTTESTEWITKSWCKTFVHVALELLYFSVSLEFRLATSVGQRYWE